MGNTKPNLLAIAVNVILILLALFIATIGVLSLKENQSVQSLLLNISTELGGAALIFFILKYFSLDGESINSIDEKLNKINADTEIIKQSSNVQNTIEVQKQLNTLQSSVGHLTTEFGKLSDRVLAEFSSQQKESMKSLQKQFQEYIDNSRDSLERSISRELSNIIPAGANQKAISDLMTEHIKNAIYTMGQFQSFAIEREMQNALERANTKVTKKVQEVGKEVKVLQTQIESLQTLLPVSKKSLAE